MTGLRHSAGAAIDRSCVIADRPVRSEPQTTHVPTTSPRTGSMSTPAHERICPRIVWISTHMVHAEGVPMPGGRGSSLKDPDMYEELRKDGASKEKAARISNAAASQGRSHDGTARGRGRRLRGLDRGTAPRTGQGTRHHGILGEEEERTDHDAAQPLTPWKARGDGSTERVRPLQDHGIRRVRGGSGFRYAAPTAVRSRRTTGNGSPDSSSRPPGRTCGSAHEPNGHIQAVGTDDAGRRQYLYHARLVQRSRTEGKFARALDARRSASRARVRVTQSLRRAELDRERVLATAFRLLDRPLRASGRSATHGSRKPRTHDPAATRCVGGRVATSLVFPGKSGKRAGLRGRGRRPRRGHRRARRWTARVHPCCALGAARRRVAPAKPRRGQRLRPSAHRRDVHSEGLPHPARNVVAADASAGIGTVDTARDRRRAEQLAIARPPSPRQHPRRGPQQLHRPPRLRRATARGELIDRPCRRVERSASSSVGVEAGRIRWAAEPSGHRGRGVDGATGAALGPARSRAVADRRDRGPDRTGTAVEY